MNQKIIGVFAAAAVMVLLSACAPKVVEDRDFIAGEQDKLTEVQLDALIWYAQQYLSRAPEMRKLSDAHRAIIRETRPETRVQYTAPRYGRLILRWRISSFTELLLTADGDLMTKSPPWVIRIMTTNESHPYAKSFDEGTPRKRVFVDAFDEDGPIEGEPDDIGDTVEYLPIDGIDTPINK